MALTLDDLTSKTNKFIVPRMVDIVYKASPVFTRFRTQNAERFEGGTSIQHPIMYAELKGGAFSRGGTFDISYVQTDTALQVLPKYYYVSITLYGTDNVLNRGPEAAMSYVEGKMVNASGKMAKLLATDMYNDGQGTLSSTISLDGFSAAIDDGTNYASYGQITRTDIASGDNVGINSYLKQMAAGTNLALSDIQTAFGSCWFGNEHIDLIATTQTVWDIFWNKLQPQQRFNEESSDVAKAGFRSFRYNGASVTVDQYTISGTMWLFNTAYIQFWISTLPKYQFGFTGWKEAQNTDDVSGQYLFGGNLLVTASRLMGQINSITG
jgi:hypothetical protein